MNRERPSYLWRVGIGFSVLFNTLTGGDAECFCVRMWRWQTDGTGWRKTFGAVFCNLVGKLQHKHCWMSMTKGERDARRASSMAKANLKRLHDDMQTRLEKCRQLGEF